MNETTNLNVDSMSLDSINNMWGLNVDSSSLMMDPALWSTLWILWIIFNIIGLLFFISWAYWLYLINKKLWEKYAWLSFVPIIQFYNYFTASKKSPIKYLLIPFIIMLLSVTLWTILTWAVNNVIWVLVMIASYIYFIVMWVKLLHAISIRTWNWAWTTVWFFFVSFIMFPIVWLKM